MIFQTPSIVAWRRRAHHGTMKRNGYPRSFSGGAPIELGFGEMDAPVLLGVARMGAGGELVVPEAVRREAGLVPGRPVLLVWGQAGLGGLLLLDPSRARLATERALTGIARLMDALERESVEEECPH